MNHFKNDVFAGFLVVVMSGAIIGLAWSAKSAREISSPTETVEAVPASNIQTIYDEPGAVTVSDFTFFEALYPLSANEREEIARIVAGKAGDRRQSCQRMVANVIYNDILDCGGDIEKAVVTYELNTYGTPTENVYQAVDEIFTFGKFMLDDDVFWFNDKDHYSPFHATLEVVCENDGIVFYRLYRGQG